MSDPPSPLLALVLILLAFLATVALVLLVILAFEQRAKMTRLRRELKVRLVQDRACVLRDVTTGQREHDSDLDRHSIG